MFELLYHILLLLGAFAAIVNLVLMFFLVAFIVNLREKLKEFFSDLVEMLSLMNSLSPPAPIVHEESGKKTWDEKYEEDLAETERRMRGDSGLTDLPSPKADYGEPPAIRPDFHDGLIIRSNSGRVLRLEKEQKEE
jgi:hypothetical protein